jgi:hypothetical protein
MAAVVRFRVLRPLAVATALALALAVPGSGPTARADDPPPSAQAPAGSSQNAVVAWNDHAAAIARAACIAPFDNPLHESRMYAIMHVAVHDALNAISRRSQPYAYRGKARGASPEAAVAAAARTSLLGALSDITGPFVPCHDDAVTVVESFYTEALKAVPDGPAKREGVAVGKKSAYTILAKRARDGSDTPLVVSDFPQGDEPGEYRFVADGPQFAFAPGWGEVTPFVRRTDRIRVERPYRLRSAAYARDLNEVKRLGGDGTTTVSARTAEQTEVALFWKENSPHQWNRAARDLAADHHLDLWESARMFGLLNLALADGYVATFKVKYDLLFWRPVTAIRLADTDGNDETTADPDWKPLREIPPIPDHDSGHAVEGGAAAAALRGYFGTDRLSFSLCSYTVAENTCEDDSPLTRHFTRLSQAAEENAWSRVLIGYHFRHATTVGLDHGTAIGDRVVDHAMAARR